MRPFEAVARQGRRAAAAVPPAGFADTLDYMECIAKCIANDPTKLAKAAAAVGWNLTKDSFEDTLGMFGTMPAFIQFEQVGDSLSESLGIDKAKCAEEMVGALALVSCKGSKASEAFAMRWASIDKHYMAALQEWVKSGGKNSSHLTSLIESWRKNDPGRRLATATGWKKMFDVSNSCGDKLKRVIRQGGRVSGIATTVVLAWDFQKELRKQCASECDCVGGLRAPVTPGKQTAGTPSSGGR